jgi:AcrR family transcriptional regulator
MTDRPVRRDVKGYRDISKSAPALARTGRKARGSITADAIVAGALNLAAQHGMDALSMPKLAESLGIGVTSIYWYFQNKDSLIEAMTDEAARRLHALMAPTGYEGWQDYVFALFSKLRTIMQADDLLCDLLFMRGSRLSESALLHLWPQLEEGIRLMVEAGFDHEEALQNHIILSLHTRGTVTLARQMVLAGTLASAPRVVPASLPHLARASLRQNIRGVSDTEFTTQVKRIIEGMDARLARMTDST